MARGAHFDPNIDPRLLKALEETARGYKTHNVELFSGRAARPKNPSSYHPRGGAVDVNLSDPKTGAVLNNFQDPASAQAYQAYANEVMRWAQANDPELAQQLRWGGYFGGGDWKRDWMHFDVGGADRTAGGNWNQGFDPAYVKEAGLSSAGGLEGALAAAGYTPEQRRNAIASIESAGGGDYGALGKWTGNRGEDRKLDRAYGRYQVMGENIAPWMEQYLKTPGVTQDMFLKDPAMQDALFDAVYGDYVSKYGERGAASKWFTGSENEPAVTDVNGKLTGGTYADKYMKALEASRGTTVRHPPNATVGTGDLPEPKETKTDKKKKGWADYFTDFGEDMLKGGIGTSAPGYNLPAIPQAALAANTPTTISSTGPGSELDKRAELTDLLMKRLNSGKLF